MINIKQSDDDMINQIKRIKDLGDVSVTKVLSTIMDADILPTRFKLSTIYDSIFADDKKRNQFLKRNEKRMVKILSTEFGGIPLDENNQSIVYAITDLILMFFDADKFDKNMRLFNWITYLYDPLDYKDFATAMQFVLSPQNAQSMKINGKEVQVSAKHHALLSYMSKRFEEYLSIALLLHIDGDLSLKLSDDELLYMTKLLINDYIQRVLAIYNDKDTLNYDLQDNLLKLLSEHKKIQSKYDKLYKEHQDLKNRVKYNSNVKEIKVVQEVSDTSELNRLNKLLDSKDSEISKLQEQVKELELLNKKAHNNLKESELEIDFSKKILVVGGHNNTISKLCNLFDNALVFNKTEDNITKQQVEDCDYILYLTNWLSHPIYHKIKSMTTSKQTVIHCCKENLGVILQTMSEIINGKVEDTDIDFQDKQ